MRKRPTTNFSGSGICAPALRAVVEATLTLG
eukprot:CAMPEP_0195099482 /NCGR_PEP_ID=MMETSP0448-20130528/58308_1 /TAXON_ID=66468 /ORGANISM="Heterocapsa triquestra, Strain CCMP 448" /LENGTH=30 /DNA_ID= /DNA_START= /DNA_END= /DNA_ORIENTATION=